MDRYIVREGMVVRSADGEKLGKVVSRQDGSFTIEKGLFFKKDFVAGEAEIAQIADDEIWLTAQRDEIEQRGVSGAEPMSPASAGEAPLSGAGAESARPRVAGESPVARAQGITEETRIPVAEEELEIEKKVRKVGEVRVRKEVVTEQRQVTVPVTREEVKVERIPVDEAAGPGEASFKEGEVRIPLTEEEVEVRKRPVVREEVRVSKTAVEEQRVASGSVRREEVAVESEGDVERRSRPYPDEDPLTRK
jgi:uncharacterized protein (TIGR02271 family)